MYSCFLSCMREMFSISITSLAACYENYILTQRLGIRQWKREGSQWQSHCNCRHILKVGAEISSLWGLLVENRKQWFFASANCSTLDCQLHSRELLYYLHMYTNVVCSVHTQSYNRIKVFRKINPDSLYRIYAKDGARDTNFFSNFCYPIK